MIVAIRGGYRMASGWQNTKLYLVSALLHVARVCVCAMHPFYFILPCFLFIMLSLKLRRCSSDFPVHLLLRVSQTQHREKKKSLKKSMVS